MQSGIVFSILGRALVVMALSMLPSVLYARIDSEPVVLDAFLTAMLVSLFIGGLLLLAFRNAERTERAV